MLCAAWLAAWNAQAFAQDYRSVFPTGPTGVEERLEDWKKANEAVGRFRRGHIDILKQEPADPPAPAAAQAPVLDAEAAVRLAMENNPRLAASLASLAIGDADRRSASSLPNPHLAFGRIREGQTVELERMLSFNVLNLITLPWRARYASERLELAKLGHAQEVIRLSAETRKAWVRAVAARQTALYMRQARDAAEAGAELARRMARVGNFSKLQQAREQATLAELTAQLARAEQAAVSERAALTRLLGVETAYSLPDRLPDIQQALPAREDVQAQALRDRLDVRAARDEAGYIARSLGYTRITGAFDGLELGIVRNTTFDNASGTKETSRGFELDLPLPIFDWNARADRAEATYRQATARVREVALLARSEAGEAWHGWRTAHELAKHYEREIVPLRKFISDETLLRYNGMLASVWELLAETRNHVAAINGAIDAQRDFWLADTDLNTALTGTSPGGLNALQGKKWTEENSSAGH